MTISGAGPTPPSVCMTKGMFFLLLWLLLLLLLCCGEARPQMQC